MKGKLNAYRRMIYEDERAPAAEKLDFVLHLGDFIYEVVEYPDEVKTRYDRTIYEVARIPDGHKVGNFHIPLTVDGYRAIYKAISPIPTSRTLARAGRSSRSGTTTNSRGKAGKASSRRDRSSSLARAVRSPAHQGLGSNTSRHVWSPPRVTRALTIHPAVKDVPIKEVDNLGLGGGTEHPDRRSTASRAYGRCTVRSSTMDLNPITASTAIGARILQRSVARAKLGARVPWDVS
jgi:hypothetical protein